MEKFWSQMTDSVSAFADHENRETITPEDIEHFAKRNHLTSHAISFYDLARKYLPWEYAEEVKPIAQAKISRKTKKKR